MLRSRGEPVPCSAAPGYLALLGLFDTPEARAGRLRLPSAVAGIASAALAYPLCRAVATPQASLVMSGLVAFGPSFVRYSREVREYSVGLLATTGFLLCLDGCLAGAGLASRLGLALATWASCALQFGTSLLVMAAVAALPVLPVGRRGSRRHALGAIVLGGLLALPLVAPAAREIAALGPPGRSGASSYLAHGYLGGRLQDLPGWFLGNGWDFLGFLAPTPGLLLVLLGLACWPPLPTRRIRLLGLAAAPVLLVVLAGAAGWYPWIGDRQTLFLAPGLLALAAAGLDRLEASARGIASPLVALCLLVPAFGASIPVLRARGPEDLQPVARALSALAEPDDAIWVYYGAWPAWRLLAPDLVGRSRQGHDHRERPSGYPEELLPVLGAKGDAWLVFSHVYGDEREQILGFVARTHDPVDVVRTEGCWLYRASRRSSRRLE